MFLFLSNFLLELSEVKKMHFIFLKIFSKNCQEYE